ncbi:MAG: VTT domain-containing protein [Desulfobacterales bacterium]|jgi:membrane protein DedA with SNARE-associated domain
MIADKNQLHRIGRPIVIMCIILLMAAHVSRADRRSSSLSVRSGSPRFSFAALSKTPSKQTFTAPTSDASPLKPSSALFLGKRIEGADGLVMTMILIALATLVSEDLTCIGAGLMAARGVIGLTPAVAASFTGIFVGDILLYLAGRFIGQPALRHPPLKWLIKRDDVARASRWFADKGAVIVLTSRFLPGSRLPTYFSAGMLGADFRRFSLYLGLAAALWTPILVGTSSLVGHQMFAYFDLFKQYGIWVLLATVLLLWLILKTVVPVFSSRGRRLLLSSWRRKTRWEFWSPTVFYLPVAVYVLWLGIKHRSLTLFTAANPGIPDGGFIGESKSRILEQLQDRDEFVARFDVIPADMTISAKIERAKEFMHRNGGGFPVVLKPDAGQRGTGVTVIRNRPQLVHYLEHAKGAAIIQEYVNGYEYGVFYYRYPDENEGTLFSITDKRLLTLTGDGRSTLEQLILQDDRAMCMAPFHFRHHQDRLFDVPRFGERIALVEVGTHCRGALFLDGSAVRSPALASVIDRISKRFEGFYFGRYDIRTPSLVDFRKGRNFKIVELNGVTSEATHIYQPGNSIWNAYRTLMQQWRIAFEIGAVNRSRGVQPSSAHRLLTALLPARPPHRRRPER